MHHAGSEANGKGFNKSGTRHRQPDTLGGSVAAPTGDAPSFAPRPLFRSGSANSLCEQTSKVIRSGKPSASKASKVSACRLTFARKTLRAKCEQSPFGGGNPCEQSEQSPSATFARLLARPAAAKRPRPHPLLVCSQAVGRKSDGTDGGGWRMVIC